MADGSDAIADWPLLNALVNTASGATWVSIHHGGGVGIGRSIHAGQVTVADGTPLAAPEARAGADATTRAWASSGTSTPATTWPRRWPRSAASASRWRERLMTLRPACGPTSRRSAGDGPARGGYRRFAWTTHGRRRCASGSRGEALGARAGRRRPTGPATSGPGRATRTPRPGPGRSAATSTRCPTAARSTARSASSRPSRRSTCCASSGFTPRRPRGRRLLRRRGGRPVRRRLRRVPAAHRRARPRPRPGADRRRRRRRWPRRCRPPALDAAHARPGRRGAPADRHASSSCTSSRAAGSSTRRRVGRRPRRSGRTAAGGSTSAAGPTTPAPPGWPTGDDPMLALAAAVLARPRPPPTGTARWPPSARCGSSRTASTRSRRRSPPGSTPAAPPRTTSARWSRDVGSAARHRAASRSRGRRRPTFDAGLRDRLAALLGGAPGAARPAPVTTPASWPRPASRRRCCSSATRPASPTPRRARRAGGLPGRGRAPSPRADRGTWRDEPYWCEHALARRRAPVAGRPRRRGRRPDHRRSSTAPTPRRGDAAAAPAWSCPASPTRTRTPSTGRCAAAPTTAGGTFWTWRERMYAVAARLDPDSYLALARATYAEMALAGVTCVGEFHYLHHPRRRRPLRRPERDGGGAVEAAADAGVRLTLLDTCYLAGGLDGDGPPAAGRRPAAVLRRRRRRAGPPGSPRCPSGRGCGSARRCTRCAPCPPSSWPPSRPRPRGRPAARAPLRAARRERGLPARSTAARPTALLPTAGVLGPDTTAVHATHLTDDDVAALGGTGTAVCACPSTEADLADGIGPFRRLRDAGSPLCLGSDQHALTDLLERGPRCWRPHERLVTGERGRFRPAELVDALTVAGHRALGWPDAGRHRRRAAGRPGRRPPGQPAHRRRARPARLVMAAAAADVHTVVVDGRVVVVRRPARARRRRPRCWPTRSHRLWEDRMSTAGHRHRRAGHQRPRAGCGVARPTPRSSSTTAPSPGSGRAATRPTADRRIDVGGRAVVPGFVDSHAHLVFAGDRAAEFEARMSGVPLRRRRHRHDRRGHPRGHRRRAARPAARAGRRDARPGHHDRRGQERLRPDRRRRGPRRCGWPREVTPETTFLGAHVVPAGADRATSTSPWSPARCSPPAPRTPGGSTSSASRPRRTPSTATRPARCSRPAAPPGWACGCTPTSSRPGPGVQLAVELGRRQRRPLHPPHRRRRRRARRRDDGRDPAARRRVLHPLAVPGRPPAARGRGDGRAGHRLQPGQLLHVLDGRSASPSPSARCG